MPHALICTHLEKQMLLGLRTAICAAHDLPAAKAWYTAALGFGPYFDEPYYVGFKVGGFELGLIPNGAPAVGACTIAPRRSRDWSRSAQWRGRK